MERTKISRFKKCLNINIIQGRLTNLITKVYSSTNILWSKIISFLVAPYFKFVNIFRKKYDFEKIEIKTILVAEYHRIGDVIIIIPAMEMIRDKYPNAKIILLCNYEVMELATHLNVADQVIQFNAPWTNRSWNIFDWFNAMSFAKKISNMKVDLAFDFKGDIRNSWFLWNLNPKISFGYNATGGDYFFTHPHAMDQRLHQSARAINLASKAGCFGKVKEQQQRNNNDGAIIFHTGATDFRRSWPDKHWIKLVRFLGKKHKLCIVRTAESIDLIQSLKKENSNLNVFDGTLLEFFIWLKRQRCIIAPDSMAGHLAAFVGIPVISIFGSQPAELTRPLGEICDVVSPHLRCAHKSKHWRLCSDCMESVSPEEVNSVVEKLLSNEDFQKNKKIL